MRPSPPASKLRTDEVMEGWGELRGLPKIVAQEKDSNRGIRGIRGKMKHFRVFRVFRGPLAFLF